MMYIYKISTQALVMVNNTSIESDGDSRPYIIKLCFARN